jgi:hypothetical protein
MAKKSKANFANAGANISKNEALKIANNKDISVAQVMDRALGKGRTLGASLVNQYNKGKLDNRSYIQKATDNVFLGMGGKSQYQPESLSKLNSFGQMPKGSVYGGMTSTGTPILGTKMPKDLINAKTQTTGGGMGGSGTAASDTGTADITDTAVAAPAAVEPTADATSMDPYQTALANWAQGFRRKKSSRQMAGRTAQGFGSKRVAPQTNTLGV